MKKRIRLVKKVKIKINKLVLIATIFLILLGLIFNFINKRLTPVLMEYADLKCRKIATIVINEAVKKELEVNFKVEELFILSQDSKGAITSVDFNPIIVNKMLTSITTNIQKNLKEVEKGNIKDYYEVDPKKLKKGIIYEIPSGVVFNNSLLANIGPKVPVKLNFVGDIASNIETTVTNYGINNALIKINILITINEKIILPFSSKTITVKSDIPVALKLIQGSVPNYYFKGMNDTSQILTVPVE